MPFNNSLIQLRNKHNLTQKEFAKKIGVSTGMLAEWESGESEPNLEQLAKISSVFNITLDSLITNNNTNSSINIEQNYNDSTEITLDNNKHKTSNKSKKHKVIILCIVSLFVVISIFTICAFTFSDTKPKSFSDNTNAIAQVENSVVKIHCFDHNNKESSTGSGFIAFDSQTVVTNYHVACEGYTMKISTNEDLSFDVKSIITYSEEKDIAILKLKEDTGLSPLVFGNPDETEKGESVTAIGSPLGIKNSVSQGIFSGRIVGNEFDTLQFTASISSGSSGGALFNSKGEVIGVTFASYEDGQNLNLAIPVNIVSDLYDQRFMPTETSLLYRRTYPYVDYLTKAKETTIKDFENNPTEYTGNCIFKSAYISSFNDSSIENSSKIYITEDKSLVSGNFTNDDASNNPSLLSISLDTSGDFEASASYLDKSIEVGSCSTIVVNHKYMQLDSGIIQRITCKAIVKQEE